MVATISRTGLNVLEDLERMRNFWNNVLSSTRLMTAGEMEFGWEIPNMNQFDPNTDFGHSEPPKLLEGGPVESENPREDPPSKIGNTNGKFIHRSRVIPRKGYIWGMKTLLRTLKMLPKDLKSKMSRWVGVIVVSPPYGCMGNLGTRS